MVQGWESRAHLANKRREEARERKQSKKGPQKLNGEVIINQILKNSLIDLYHHTLEAWVENERGGKSLCYPHFRAEACLNHKRCKFSHELTISLNRGHEYVANDAAEGTTRSEVHMDCYSDLMDIPSKEYTHLSLLFLDRCCIYDKNNPKTWQQWFERTNNQQQQGIEGLHTITEVESVYPDDESVQSMDKDTDFGLDLENLKENVESKQSTHAPASCHCHLTNLPPPLINTILSFVSDIDLCYTYLTAFTMKTVISTDEGGAYRRKNYLASVTLTGKDLSKLKKLEKKKKQKQANAKDTKKGHKAVKVCRR